MLALGDSNFWSRDEEHGGAPTCALCDFLGLENFVEAIQHAPQGREGVEVQ